MSADIEKMYRQIALNAEAKDYHRLIWRFAENQRKTHLLMKRVTYGIKSSEYHAVRAMQETTKLNQKSSACKVILNNLYVNELLTGAEDVKPAIRWQDELMSTLMLSKILLRKWTPISSGTPSRRTQRNETVT